MYKDISRSLDKKLILHICGNVNRITLKDSDRAIKAVKKKKVSSAYDFDK